MTDIKSLFATFIAQFDHKAADIRWNQYSDLFHQFWKSKILDQNQKVSDSEFDAVIKMLDTKAKGFNSKVDEAVAMTGVRQGVWYRAFHDLKSKKDLRDLLSHIFVEKDLKKLIDLINLLQKANKPLKNGLTGKNANILNALLFINDPTRFISSVSLNHRKQFIEKFKLADFNSFATYGEQIVNSNSLILDFLSRNVEGNWSPRTFSKFLYHDQFESLWLSKLDDTVTSSLEENEPIEPQRSEFVLEKHLEDFLVANWESSSLGETHDLIEENEEIVSQQYPTDVGKIDLLVRSKADHGYTVIELKKGQTSDDTVGQLARYMGWVKANLSKDKNVRGIVIAGGQDDRLKYALSVFPNTKLLIYRVNFSLDEVG